MENKKDKFRRIAIKRAQVILDELRKLGNCSNSSIYEYSKVDVDKMFKAIKESVEDSKSRFRFPQDPKKFKL